MAVGWDERETPSTASRFEAGPGFTRRTPGPWSAEGTAAAQAMEVLPTPPLPAKKRERGAGSRNDSGIPFVTSLVRDSDHKNGTRRMAHHAFRHTAQSDSR
jgi:hypothetical protein